MRNFFNKLIFWFVILMITLALPAEARRIRGISLQRVLVGGIELTVNPQKDPRVPGEEAVLIETETTQEYLRQIAKAIKNNEKVMLIGLTGVGKSSLVKYLAHLTNNVLYWMNLSEQTDPAELIGKFVPAEGGKFKWIDGILVRAMKEGAWILLDDINLAPPAVLERINSLLDEDGYLVITEHEGEIVRPHPNFRLFVARNPQSYAGRQRLSEAFINKFHQIYINPLPKEEQKEIILAKLGEIEDKEAIAQAMVDLQERVIQLAESEQFGRSRIDGYHFGLRDLISWAEYIKAYGERFGILNAIGLGAVYVYRNRLETDEARERFDLELANVSINGEGLNLSEILRYAKMREEGFIIEPTLANILRYLVQGIPQGSEADLAIEVMEELLNSKFAKIEIQGLVNLAKLPGAMRELVMPVVITRLLELARDSSNWDVQRAAATALVALGVKDKEVIDRLLELTRDSNVRYTTVTALGTIGVKDKEVIDWLLEVTKDKELYVRRAAAEALGALGVKDKEVIDRLLELARDNELYVREAAAKALGALGVKDKEVIDKLLELTRDSNWEVRGAAAEALGAIGVKDKEVIDRLVELTRDRDSYVRRAAAEALGALGVKDKEVIDKLLELLRDRDWNVRYAAAKALGAIGVKDKEVIDRLLELTRDRDSDVRRAAVEALGALGVKDKEVIDRLLELSKDRDSNVRYTTVTGLEAIGVKDKEVIDRLLELLRDRDWNVRYAAAKALGALGVKDKEVIDRLLKLTRDREWIVRYAAATALVALGIKDKEVIDRLVELSRDRDSDARKAAAKALGALGIKDKEVIDCLLELLRDSYGGVRRAAAEALGALGVKDKEVIDRLLKLTRDSEEEVRSAAVSALEKLLLDNLSSLLSPYTKIIEANIRRWETILRGEQTITEVEQNPLSLLERFGISPNPESNPFVPSLESSELVLIPTTLSVLEAILPAIRENEPVMLVGPTGAGKTALVRYLAHLTNNGYIRINLKDMTDISELVGGYIVRDGEIVWQDSLLVQAMREGWWVVLDEANLAGSGVLERLNQLLDRNGYLELPEHEGEIIKPHPNFRLFVTMNPLDYAGRKILSPAFLNRFRIIWVDEPTDTELIALVSEKYHLEPDIVTPVVQFHHNLKKLAEERQLGEGLAERYVYTIRDLQRLFERVSQEIEESNLADFDEIMRLVVREIRDVYGARLVTKEDKEIFENLLKIHFPPEWL